MHYPWIARIIFLSVAVWGAACSQAPQELTALREENQRLSQEVDSLRKQLNVSRSSISVDTSGTAATELISESDVAFLRKRGLPNPVTDIKQSLIDNPQLIPQEGVLGGTMRFFEDQIHVLNHKWVLAYFEDGHQAGDMLLTYDVQNGKIAWKVIRSELR